MRITQDKLILSNLVLDSLIITLLRDRQADCCNNCKRNIQDVGFQGDHLRYGIDITLYDLQLLCGDCHAKKTGVKSCNGTLRYI